MFCCSPVENEEKELVQLGKKLRKNKVAIDIVNFGHPENTLLLQGLVDACNNSDNSHFVDISEGVTNVTDAIIASPVINEDVGADAPMADGGAGAAAPGQFDMYGGVDPSVDPELANAIWISLEEAKKNEEDHTTNQDNNAEGQQPPAENAKPEGGNAPDEEMADEGEDDEEARLLWEAIELSKQDEANEPKKEEAKQEETKKDEKEEENLGEVLDEDFLGELMKDFDVDLDAKDVEKCLKKGDKKDDDDKDTK